MYPALQQGPSLLPKAPHAYGTVSRPTQANVCVCGNTWTSNLCSVYSSPWSLALCIAMLRGHLHTWIKDKSCFYLPLKPASGTRSGQQPVCESISQVKHLEAPSIQPPHLSISFPSVHLTSFILSCNTVALCFQVIQTLSSQWSLRAVCLYMFSFLWEKHTCFAVK